MHLHFPAPEGNLYYNEMVVEQSVPGSYFMACGWDTGYFGLQQLDRAEDKVVLFSVWDPTRGDDPNAVQSEDRVEVLAQGEGVRIRRFGGEGTGGQCMAPCPWKLGETNRFVVQGEVQGDKTPTPRICGWRRSSPGGNWPPSARAPVAGRCGATIPSSKTFAATARARSRPGARPTGMAGCARSKNKWTALDHARFTASNAVWESRDNIDAGLAGSRFYLATGGSITSQTKLQGVIQLPVAPAKPPSLDFLGPASRVSKGG